MAADTQGRHLVLVVEDEPLLRMMAVDMIEDAGFEAIEAADAIAATELLESRDDIELVFTDIDMPRGMSGLKLAIAIRDRWPPIHLIITSGKPFPADSDMPAGSEFFPKPYRQVEVVDTMRRMVA